MVGSLGAMVSFVVVVLAAASVGAWPIPDTLVAWQDAMCDYDAKLRNDTATGACAHIGDCQRLDEQPERMCIAGGRAEQIMSACLASNLHAANTYNTATALSWFHHVGLLASYVRDGGISFALYLDDLGDPNAPDARAFPSLSAAKRAIRSYAAAIFDPLVPVRPRALSGYGWSLYWQTRSNLCTDG